MAKKTNSTLSTLSTPSEQSGDKESAQNGLPGNSIQPDEIQGIPSGKGKDETFTFCKNKINIDELVSALRKADCEAGQVSAAAYRAIRDDGKTGKGIRAIATVGGGAVIVPTPSVVTELVKGGYLGDISTPKGKLRADALAKYAKAVDRIIDGLEMLGIAKRL